MSQSLQTYIWNFNVEFTYPVTVWAIAHSNEDARRQIITQLTALYAETSLDPGFIHKRCTFAPDLCENGVLIPEVVKALHSEPSTIIPTVLTVGFSISTDG